MVKKYTDITQLDAIIIREFVEQIRASDTYTTDKQQKQVKIYEIEIVHNFIGAFDFEGGWKQSQIAQDNHKQKSAQHNAMPTLTKNVFLRHRPDQGRFFLSVVKAVVKPKMPKSKAREK